MLETDSNMTRWVQMRSKLIVGLAMAFSVLGCDKKKQEAEHVDVPASRPAVTRSAATRPSTQDLLNGPRKSLILGALPLRMSVPETWKIVTADSASWLEGSTPHGFIRMQLSAVLQGAGSDVGNPVTFNSETLALHEKKAEKDAAASSGTIEVVPLHSLGVAAKVMERREVYQGSARGFDGEPQPTKMMDWSIEVYVPQAMNYTLDLLHFMALTNDQYQQDKDFLEKILATLHYDAAKGLLD
jgi:hypothetical protein